MLPIADFLGFGATRLGGHTYDSQGNCLLSKAQGTASDSTGTPAAAGEPETYRYNTAGSPERMKM